MKIKQCTSYKDTQYVRLPRFSFIIKCRKWNIVYFFDNNSENSKDIRLKVIQKSTCCKCSHLTINPTLIHSFHSFALSWSGSHSLSQEHWEQHIATKLLMPLFVSQVCGNSWPVHDRLQFDPDEHWPRTGSGTRTWTVEKRHGWDAETHPGRGTSLSQGTTHMHLHLGAISCGQFA